MTYNEMWTEIDRMEAEAGCELPTIRNRTLVACAGRLLDCDDPPKGHDAELCMLIAAGLEPDDGIPN